VVFDTAGQRGAAGRKRSIAENRGMHGMRNILSALDVPELEPVPREQVLTKRSI